MSVTNRASWMDAQTADRARSLRAAGIPIPKVRLRIDLRDWNRQYPLVIPTVLLALAALTYLLQVNQGALFDLSLQGLHIEQTQRDGQLGILAARWDHLLSCERVCSIAVAKYKMIHPDLTSALWLKVRLPGSMPALPRHAAVHVGALSWLEEAATTVRKSL